MSIFKGIESTPASNQGHPRLGPGTYFLEVSELRSFKSKKPPFTPFFVADFKVLESSNGDHPVNSIGSWLVNMQHSPALGNIKAFALALIPGLTEADITAEAMDAMVGDSQECRGMRVRADVYSIQTKAGHPFDKVTFRPSGE